MARNNDEALRMQEIRSAAAILLTQLEQLFPNLTSQERAASVLGFAAGAAAAAGISKDVFLDVASEMWDHAASDLKRKTVGQA